MGLFVLYMGNISGSSLLIVQASEKQQNMFSEYKQLVKQFKDRGISVIELIRDTDIESPRYLCSGDWITFHGNGTVTVYPLSSLSRQQERTDLVFDVLEENAVRINDVVDFTEAENDGFFLEGTSSMVLDHTHSIAYAIPSLKCDEELFIEFCEELEFSPILFRAQYTDTSEVLSASSVLSVSDDFAVIALELIKDKKEKKQIVKQLKKSGKELIYITEKQVANHTTQIKQVKNCAGECFVVLSKNVFDNLNAKQAMILKKYGELFILDYKHTEGFAHHSIGAALNEISF